METKYRDAVRRDIRCLGVDQLAWAVRLTVCTAAGVAVISHVVPREHICQRVTR